MNKKITLAITSALLSTCFTIQSAYAEFQAQDPRSLGMGGVGVAAANSAQAQFYNPSLLANAKEDEDFNFEVPATARVADPDNLSDSLIEFADQEYFTQFADSFLSTTTAIDEGRVLDLPALLNTLIGTSKSLQKGFNDISGKSLISSGNLAFLVSAPGKKLGWSGYINVWADAGARVYLGPNDNLTMSNFISDLENITTGVLPDQLTDPTTNLDSSLSIDAAVVTEFGVSLAMPTTVNNYGLDVGLTPKIMNIRAFSFTQVLGDVEKNNGQLELGTPLIYNAFNIDFGMSKQLNKNWKSGLTIKNLLPQSFKLPNNNSFSAKEIKLAPAMRIGTSYQNNWATIAADLDITKNKGFASKTESQYLAIGTELDVWLVKLRFGYRANLAASNNNTFSTGLGLYLFGLNIDSAVAVGEGNTGLNDVSASLQVGVQW